MRVESCVHFVFSLLFVLCCLWLWQCPEGHETSLCPFTHRLELLGPSWLIHVREAQDEPSPPKKPLQLCMFGPPTLQWGWTEACNHTIGGDETCELFMASEMFHDERTFVEIADTTKRTNRSVSLGRLKQRLVQATLEERSLSLLVLGPSTTFGSGCPVKQLRWTDALQNLSNFKGSPLNASVFNEARRGTKFKGEWRYVLTKYRNKGKRVDLIVIDYSATAKADDKAEGDAVLMLHTFIHNWTRPPAILFLANWHGQFQRGSELQPCNHAEEDAFYWSVKELQIPMLSYPDIACHLPSLNRTSRSKSGVAFYHSYVDLPVKKTPIHFGCGVHLILAHAVHLYLKKLLQDSCGSSECTGSQREICSAGFQSVQEELETPVVVELSPDQKCEVTPQTSIRCDQFDGCNLPALVGKSSNWKLGAERKSSTKPGWVANSELKWVWPVQYDLAKHYLSAKLPATDILFLLRLSVGTVFLDYLATYENIGSITCGLEDLKGRKIGPSFRVEGLWSRSVSLVERVKISASQVPELPPKEVNAVLRCREAGQKFKIFGITSC